VAHTTKDAGRTSQALADDWGIIAVLYCDAILKYRQKLKKQIEIRSYLLDVAMGMIFLVV